MPATNPNPVRTVLSDQPKMLSGMLGDVSDSLQTLATRGFRLAETCDARGAVVAMTAVRVHHNVIDIVQLFGEYDANAMRIPASEPDIFSPRNVLWRVTGTANTVLTSILGLADPNPEPAAEQTVETISRCG